MAYISREDGERFIIPSYRDVLTAAKPALLKKEVLLLSASYGEYITLQRKGTNQYEAAFSPESGYLFGETVLNYFKRPRDMIYCEAIPNTTEAILVIVKGGSVYLDGSFPVDSIPDELVIFRTQQNSFDIYVYGDIPLSATPEEGKFSLDASSIKSFNVLPDPIFPTLPTLKLFQLRPVEEVLKSQGIGVLPVKKIIMGIIALILIWSGIMYLSSGKKELPAVFVNAVNPYQAYLTALQSPAPTAQIEAVSAHIEHLYSIPGWLPVTASYTNHSLTTKVRSSGTKLDVLYQWAQMNGAQFQIAKDGVSLTMPIMIPARMSFNTISPLQQVLAELLDRISTVIPGNNLSLGTIVGHGPYSETQLTISFSDLTLDTLDSLAEQLKGLPLVLSKMNVTINNGTLSGILVLDALGN